MAQGVYTLRKRLKFVQKELADCGDYTDFAIEVTGVTIKDKLDKIAEVYYRVKIAQFTENTLISDPTTSSGVTLGDISPRVMVGTAGLSGTDPILLSGYWSIDDLGIPTAASAVTYLTDQYSVAVGSGVGSATSPVIFRDIGTQEAGGWLHPEAGENPTWNERMSEYLGLGTYFYTGLGTEMGLDDQNFKNAFSWYSISTQLGYNVAPDIPVPYIVDESFSPDLFYEELAILVQFSGEVAWVGESIFHPDTQFFLGARVDGRFYSGVAYFNSWGSAGTEVASRYIMRLSTGDISCPLITDTPGVLTGDIVHEATEWWPYQDAGGNVWNPATGLPA